MMESCLAILKLRHQLLVNIEKSKEGIQASKVDVWKNN